MEILRVGTQGWESKVVAGTGLALRKHEGEEGVLQVSVGCTSPGRLVQVGLRGFGDSLVWGSGLKVQSKGAQVQGVVGWTAA